MLRIVLADDNVRAVDGLAGALDFAALGYTCCGVAYNGKQALELALRHRANVVITDVRMPIMDGLELSRRLRVELPGVAIIILSAYDEFDYARSAMTSGVEDYVLKPLDKDKLRGIAEILAKIRRRLDRRAAVLARISEPEVREDLCACLARDADEKARRRIRELLGECGSDFSCAQDAGGRILALLYERLAGPPGTHDLPTLERALEALAAETGTEGVLRYVTETADALARRAATLRQRALRSVVGAIAEHIDGHFKDPALTVRVLLARFHVSSSYLHQAFRVHLGTTPNAYITRRRLEHARELLDADTRTVAEAARESGYRDPHYFARAFRKRYGTSPAEYRRLARAAPSP